MEGNKVTLYKKDSKDNIRFWSIWTEGADIVQESGIVGTDNPVENRKTAKAKNVGRSNETTPEEQAISEMESSIQKKLDKAYFKTQKEAEEEEVILPMLAKTYKSQKKKVVWNDEQQPVFVQPKLDGMRCLAIIKDHKVKLISRGGKEITTMDHIKDSLRVFNNMTLDGELYAHGYSFQENMKMIKKYRQGKSEKVHFHIYDVVSDADYGYRSSILNNVFARLDVVELERVPTYIAETEEIMKDFHTAFLSDGYEGTIIRHGSDGYKINGRSSSLLKVKDFEDIALPIIDIIPADQRPEWGLPVFELNGETFKAGWKMSHAEREDLLENKEDYIGKTAELRFFEYSDTGVPRHPVMLGIREDK